MKQYTMFRQKLQHFTDRESELRKAALSLRTESFHLTVGGETITLNDTPFSFREKIAEAMDELAEDFKVRVRYLAHKDELIHNILKENL